MQAKLPKDKLEKTVADLKVGESAYTVPWTIKVDHELGMWVDNDSDISTRAGGTYNTKVTRVLEGFEVEIVRSETFRPQSIENLNISVVVKVTWV